MSIITIGDGEFHVDNQLHRSEDGGTALAIVAGSAIVMVERRPDGVAVFVYGKRDEPLAGVAVGNDELAKESPQEFGGKSVDNSPLSGTNSETRTTEHDQC